MDIRKNECVIFKVTKSEKLLLKTTAKDAKKSLSDYIRQKLDLTTTY